MNNDHIDPPPSIELPPDLVVRVIVEQPAEVEPPPVVNSSMPKITETGEPWNVVNMRAAHAAAVNNYTKIKTEFDENFPAPPPEPEPTPLSEPQISPISAGMPIDPDPAKYVVVRTERRRNPA